jgi:hypothetical protein
VTLPPSCPSALPVPLLSEEHNDTTTQPRRSRDTTDAVDVANFIPRYLDSIGRRFREMAATKLP